MANEAADSEHWMLKIVSEKNVSLLAAYGKSLPEFLKNAPNLCARARMVFPGLDIPQFSLTEVSRQSLQLHCVTQCDEYAQLMPLVLSRLGQMFDTPIEISHVKQRQLGADHDVFLLRWTLG